MTTPAANQLQLRQLADILLEMSTYLGRVEQLYDTLQLNFQSAERSDSWERLLKIMEGLDYCKKMFHAAIALLEIDAEEKLTGEISMTVFNAELYSLFDSVYTATDNGDYSLVADLAEYDLLPVLQMAQQLVGACLERLERQKGLVLVNGNG